MHNEHCGRRRRGLSCILSFSHASFKCSQSVAQIWTTCCSFIRIVLKCSTAYTTVNPRPNIFNSTEAIVLHDHANIFYLSLKTTRSFYTVLKLHMSRWANPLLVQSLFFRECNKTQLAFIKNVTQHLNWLLKQIVLKSSSCPDFSTNFVFI